MKNFAFFIAASLLSSYSFAHEGEKLVYVSEKQAGYIESASHFVKDGKDIALLTPGIKITGFRVFQNERGECFKRNSDINESERVRSQEKVSCADFQL